MATTSICKLQVLLGCVYILLPCIYIHQEYPLGGMYLDRDNRLTVLDSQMPKKSMFNLIPFPPMLSLVNSSLHPHISVVSLQDFLSELPQNPFLSYTPHE